MPKIDTIAFCLNVVFLSVVCDCLFQILVDIISQYTGKPGVNAGRAEFERYEIVDIAQYINTRIF